jgi:F-type H+-transporting ATPase subunit c
MKITKILFTTLAMVLVASVAFAAPEGAGADVMSAKAYATALGMGIAAGLCGLAQGMGVKGACEGIARNPEAAGQLSTTLILGLAFIESLAIYALVINLILLFIV